MLKRPVINYKKRKFEIPINFSSHLLTFSGILDLVIEANMKTLSLVCALYFDLWFNSTQVLQSIKRSTRP